MTTTHDRLHHIAGNHELTIRGMILGALITVLFTASNVYLGLKVGMTFASSIPAAVISMAVLRFCRNSNILENNMVQTQASAAGTLAAIIFVIPGLLMLGYWQGFPFWQTFIICAAGGILGVLFSIPLRHVMVVKSDLPYPEGVAAAEILKTGDADSNKDDNKAGNPQEGMKLIASGSAMAALFSFCMGGLRVVGDSISTVFSVGGMLFQPSLGFSFALLGAGYLVGITGAVALIVGTLLAWGVFVPYYSTVFPAAADISAGAWATTLWVSKVRYIGAGCIAVAAIWTLIVLFKPLVEGVRMSFRAMGDKAQDNDRIYQDMSPKTILMLAGLMLLILLATFWNFVAASGFPVPIAWLLVFLCVFLAAAVGFLVAAACGYMAGLVGSSSSPISGISIISMIFIAIVFIGISNAFDLFAYEGGQHFMTALALLTVSVVLAMATISNDNLQDLKTGLLVNATPWRQQIALVIGCIVGALVIAPTLNLLYEAYGFTGAMPRPDMDPTQALSAPQASLMTTIVQGIFNANMDWTYITIGLALGVAVIIVDRLLARFNLALPPLAVGVGIYLPPAVTSALFIGGVICWLTQRVVANRQRVFGGDLKSMQKAATHRGTLLAAGFIVGESLMGVILAMVIVFSVTSGGSASPLALELENWGDTATFLGLAAFLAGAVHLFTKTIGGKITKA